MTKRNRPEMTDLDRILKIALDDPSLDQISGNDRLREDLGMNSFSMMVIVYYLEKEWGIRLALENMATIVTVEDLYRLICEAEENEKIQ